MSYRYTLTRTDHALPCAAELRRLLDAIDSDMGVGR